MGYSGNVIHFVADKWFTPSIKDIEHIDREVLSIMYKINGPSQKRPTDWTVTLKNSGFKELLIEFFVASWNDDSLAPFLRGKFYVPIVKVHAISLNHKMIRYCVPSKWTIVTMKKRIAEFFITYFYLATPSNVVMKTSDTDSLVIAMGCQQFYNTSLKLWLEVGTQSKNTIRDISIDQAWEKFGSSLCVTSFSCLYRVWQYRVIENERESHTFEAVRKNHQS